MEESTSDTQGWKGLNYMKWQCKQNFIENRKQQQQQQQTNKRKEND